MTHYSTKDADMTDKLSAIEVAAKAYGDAVRCPPDRPATMSELHLGLLRVRARGLIETASAPALEAAIATLLERAKGDAQ